MQGTARVLFPVVLGCLAWILHTCLCSVPRDVLLLCLSLMCFRLWWSCLWIFDSTRRSSFRFAFVDVCRGLGLGGFFFPTHVSGAELPLFDGLHILLGNAPLVFCSMLRLSGHSA
jgi:hypothetical protein